MTLKIFRIILFAALLFFSWLMLLITLQYVPLRPDVAFLRTKQEVVGMWHYRLAFFTHVYSSMFALAAGFLQFSAYIRRRAVRLHRAAGKVYIGTVLFLSGPSGLVMGYYGNGGAVAQAAFCSLAILWMLFTWKSYTAIRRFRVGEHRKWIYRSYALTLSAISLRLWKWLIVLVFHPKPMDAYGVVAWLGWTGNLFVAEIIILYWLAEKGRDRADKNMAGEILT